MESQQNSRPGQTLRVGIAGFGAVGRSLAKALAAGIEGLALSAIVSRDAERVRSTLPQGAPEAAPVAVVPISELAQHAELIVECAPAAILPEIAEPALVVESAPQAEAKRAASKSDLPSASATARPALKQSPAATVETGVTAKGGMKASPPSPAT